MDEYGDAFEPGPPPGPGPESSNDRLRLALMLLGAISAILLIVLIIVLLSGDDGTDVVADTSSTEAPSTSEPATTSSTSDATATTQVAATAAAPPTTAAAPPTTAAAPATTAAAPATTATTVIVLPSFVTSDCLGYDPATLAIEDLGATGWRLNAGSSALLLYDNETDALRGLALAEAFNELCFIGRGNTRPDRIRYIREYWS